jgi:hypothetical protein
MSVVKESVDVSEETRTVGKHLAALVAEGKKMAADGKVTFDEIPGALQAIIRDLIPAIAAAHAIPAEEKEDVEAFIAALLLDVMDLTRILLS